MGRHFSFILLFLLGCAVSSAQQITTRVSGQVLNQNEEPVAQVTVAVLGNSRGTTTNDTGFFTLAMPPNKAFALVFSHTGYKQTQQNFLLAEGESETVIIRLEPSNDTLQEVVVSDTRQRSEVGLIRANPKSIINLPSPVGGVESLIKVFVGSNNELTSQYNVRGGSYDENLIYVNDFEIFRPYLVRSGQQEGLSFINPELVRNISFYNGGFQARYGDKMSSVLDIQYNKPRAFGGSAYIGLLEQGLHVEGAGKKSTYLVGARHRSNENLLRAQPTAGAYLPSSSDVQGLFTYALSQKWQAEVLTNISRTSFSFIPKQSQLTTAVISPLRTQKLNATINFSGQEQDAYTTAMTGVSATYQPTKALRLKWLASYFQNKEKETIDITGTYSFGEVELDEASGSEGMVNPLGAGTYQNFARNALQIANLNVAHRGTWDRPNGTWQWGAGVDRTTINDQLNEWTYTDSAGFAAPNRTGVLGLQNVARSASNLTIYKYSGFIQNNQSFRNGAEAFTVQSGLRVNYNSLNNEFLLSPRLSASWKPAGQQDLILKAALGAYHQPPFYRELRGYDGRLNTTVKAQRSAQAVAAMDYNFKAGNRALRFTTEVYYKKLWHVVPYDIDNVRVRYTGSNNAKAYATGLEMRLFGDVVRDAESWISVGLMRTRENLNDDVYQNYTFDSTGKPIDSVTVNGGWLRRPTDRLFTVGMFFQDYLSTNKNFKVYLNALYGSNLPYNIPGSIKYRNALRIDPYIRVDIGFSALLLNSDRDKRRSHSPFRDFEAIWASVEVFNLIDRSNTISYLLVKDFANNTYAMPNRLTPRLLNVKLIARW